jgi:hypothetical protein
MTMGQETLEPVETNDIGQVKIVSSAKLESGFGLMPNSTGAF